MSATAEHGTNTEYVDTVIVGAGLSGVGAAYRAQTLVPEGSYVVLEARERIGGTWDLFRYPGVRSDSDMYTLGFPFEPWTGKRSIAAGEDIRQYIQDVADKYGITERIRFDHRVNQASWSSPQARWTLAVETPEGRKVMSCRFLFIAAGYFRYDTPHRPDFPGENDFTGRIVHPQEWPEEENVENKNVAVIGSGATGITLVPSLAARGAKRVTLIQRTPTFTIALPGRDHLARIEAAVLGSRASRVTRGRNTLQTLGFFHFSRRFPRAARAVLQAGPRLFLRGWEGYDPKHFTPPYNPWDQRLCVVPDRDLYKALRQGDADIVTGHIDRFLPRGIRMDDGHEVPADIIVTATGLSMRLAGGIGVDLDGVEADLAHRFLYRGCMVEGVPNFAVAIGYTNASWTLRADMSATLFFRVAAKLFRTSDSFAYPKPASAMQSHPAMDLTAGYVQRAIQDFPKGGDREPWRMRHDYIADRREFLRADLGAEMVYTRSTSEVRQLPAGTASL